CDCGANGKCYFDKEAQQNCECDSGFTITEEDGKKYCRECDCGENGKCYTDTEGKPNCDCNPGFLVIEKDGAQYCSGKIPYKSKNHF
ncbi:hypothetical protein NPIL_594651, partial [Nephila pilipes]